MDDVEDFLNNASLLIVDDSYYNIKMLSMILRQKWHNVRNALSYELGMKSVMENPPDIILLKSSADGCKVCETLKEHDKLKNIPIIFINNKNEKVDIDDLFNAGADDYINMPINYNEVIVRVKTQLKLYFMNKQAWKYSEKSYNQINKLNEKLMKDNNDLKEQVRKNNQQLEEITDELKEFNVMLEEEITERTKTEEALRESERQFRYSIEEAPVPVMIYAEDGEIMNINKTWEIITGYTIKDIPIASEWGKVSDIFKEDSQCSANILYSFEEGRNDGEYSVKTKSGYVRIWNFYSGYIGRLSDGRNIIIRVAMDITEKKHMEELQKSIEKERMRLLEIKEYDRIKTDFFANISHELRTPINVIFSAIQVHKLKLKDCNFNDNFPDKYKYINIMEQNCYRLLRLVNNLIDITKIDSGYLVINEINCDIVSLIEDITLSVADYIENKGLSVVFDTDIEEKIIACDPEKMERIILNLLSNAVKFTLRGGSIFVNIENGTESICIRVKDTGKGIPKEKLDSIFERFVQVDKSLTRENEGSGIGLSLVKALVELHEGTISVNSKEGYGSEFIIHIPCKLVDGGEFNYSSYEDTMKKSYIEKVNLEFSDIYN
ncbi:histidine kinase [Clostridium carboxidivorans P7]|uniref:Stage 0 sporulation protein A homolog n=1 Tax=Clostridium carboxidivorans P7 TaxID=536227 RepID=C6PWD1_9CLOT|nr:ATP-binding protein [Clostridium carboxidivorans]AKN29727.1 histidine kinase [Clostridium carboxidivorans P7]EET86481.1 multi-sensor signal transduction histidine kinase [Clostridium carboxidivorans P7]EFG89330.1 PAS domain S-box domain-containing protein [Clostridium carboxidivorans P7]